MRILRDRRNVAIRLLSVVLLLCSVCAVLAAQAPSNTTQAPSKTSRSEPFPARTIVLPQKVVAGAPFTLAVLDGVGRLTPNVAVELSGGQKAVTNSTGRATFIAPTDAGVVKASISGRQAFVSAPVVAAMAPATPPSHQEDGSDRPVVSGYPRVLTIRDRFTIGGTGFRGAAESNRVVLADQPCLVVASSPVSLVVLPGPHVPIGEILLRVTVEGHDAAPLPVSAVLLEFAGPADAPNAGEHGKLTLHVHGTLEPLAVEIRNASPGVIQFPHGSVMRLGTSGGEENSAPVELNFLSSGDYVVTARVLATDAAMRKMDSARQKLIEARKSATGSWSAHIGQLIDKINRMPENASEIRADLTRLIDGNPNGPFASLLNSALRDLNE